MRVLCWPGLSGAPVGCDFVKWVRALSPTSTGLRPADHAPRSSETSDLGGQPGGGVNQFGQEGTC